MRGAARLVAGVVAAVLPVAAWADQAPPLPEIARAQQQLESGDFEEAVKTIQAGLAEPDLTDDAAVELNRMLGLAYLYLGDQERAREAYERLLQARPDYELPRTEPPKIRSLYARIKDDIKRRRVRPVSLVADLPERTRAGEPWVVQVRIQDLALGAKPKLYYRLAGSQPFSSVDFAKMKGVRDGFVATVPAFELPIQSNPYRLEYYLEVADAAQRRLAGKGDPYNPLGIQVVPPPSSGEAAPKPEGGGGWYQNPWVWVAVGVVAAGAATGVVLVATQKQTGSLPITIRVNP